MIPAAQQQALAAIADGLEHGDPVCIVYKSASGDLTERTIMPLAQRGCLLDAYCTLRRERRTFNLSRVLRLADDDSDEIPF